MLFHCTITQCAQVIVKVTFNKLPFLSLHVRRGATIAQVQTVAINNLGKGKKIFFHLTDTVSKFNVQHTSFGSRGVDELYFIS